MSGALAPAGPCLPQSHRDFSAFWGNSGTLFLGAYNKDPTIYGTILGPLFWGGRQWEVCIVRAGGQQTVCLPAAVYLVILFPPDPAPHLFRHPTVIMGECLRSIHSYSSCFAALLTLLLLP